MSHRPLRGAPGRLPNRTRRTYGTARGSGAEAPRLGPARCRTSARPSGAPSVPRRHRHARVRGTALRLRCGTGTSCPAPPRVARTIALRGVASVCCARNGRRCRGGCLGRACPAQLSGGAWRRGRACHAQHCRAWRDDRGRARCGRSPCGAQFPCAVRGTVAGAGAAALGGHALRSCPAVRCGRGRARPARNCRVGDDHPMHCAPPLRGARVRASAPVSNRRVPVMVPVRSKRWSGDSGRWVPVKDPDGGSRCPGKRP